MLAIMPILGASAALMAQFDDANSRYVGCMFEAARHAPAGESEQALTTRLRSACTAERGQLQSLMIKVQMQRGESRQSATQAWNRLESAGIASVVRARMLANNRSG